MRPSGAGEWAWPVTGRAAASLALALGVTGCGPSDPTFALAVTNGCEVPVEVAVIDVKATLSDPEKIALYASTLEPGETITVGTPAGRRDMYVVAGVADRDPQILYTVEISPSQPEPSFTVSGTNCEIAAP